MGTIDKLTELQYRRNVIENGGEAGKQDAGRLTARERISALFDEGSFVEIDAFVNHRCNDFGMDKTEAPCEGVVTGYGSVNGTLVFVYSQDFAVISGSVGEMHAEKICKVMDMAAKMGAPIVGMIDSAGARIQEGINALAGLGKILAKNVRLSGVVPQITAVMGMCAGGAVFTPAVSDFVFMTEKASRIYLNGPQVVSAAGKEISDEDLGGAKAQAEKSGVANFVTKDENECIEQIRNLISYLPSNNLEETPFVSPSDEINRISQTLDTIIPDEGKYDVKSVIAEIVDNGEFLEVSEGYARNIVVGLSRLNGSTVGIVANQASECEGLLDSKASEKAAGFVRFCDCFNIPVVALTDVEGYVPSIDEEMNGITRRASKLLYVFAEATVPKVNVIINKAFGSAYIAMCSKQLGADIVYAWPTAEISALSSEAAANILFKDEIGASANPMATREEMIQEYKNKYASPFEAAKMGYVDDVIEPNSTRPRVIAALEMLSSKRDSLPAKKHGNMPM